MGLEFLIIALIVAKVLPNFFQNLIQDAAFAWRGEDPPSYRRQQERAKAKAERTKSNPNPPHRRYIRNAWADAIETAEETRERRRTRRARERQERWAAEDLADRIAVAEDEAYDLNPVEEATKETTEPSAEELLEELIPAAEATNPDEHPQQHSGAPANHLCTECGVWVDEDQFVQAWPGSVTGKCMTCAAPKPSERAPDSSAPAETEEDTTTYRPLHPVPEPENAKVIAFPTMNTTEETMSSAEITGLRTAITFTAECAQAALDAAAQAELAISGLTAGGTSGVAVDALRQAQEGHLLTANNYEASHADLVRQLAVADAYDANKGAGTKQFVTAD